VADHLESISGVSGDCVHRTGIPSVCNGIDVHSANGKPGRGPTWSQDHTLGRAGRRAYRGHHGLHRAPLIPRYNVSLAAEENRWVNWNGRWVRRVALEMGDDPDGGGSHGARDASPTLAFEVSRDLSDPEWDHFLERTSGGRYLQSSLWARVKLEAGWTPVRLIARRGEALLGGTQLLTRKVPMLGRVGYVSRGPVLASPDLELIDAFLTALHRLAKDLRLKMLLIIPPMGGESIANRLPYHGFRPNSLNVASTATVLVDLDQDEQALLDGMTKRTRRYLRAAERAGLTVREGDERDLPIFTEGLRRASVEKGWRVFPEKYYTNMWEMLSPGTHVRLTFARLNGRDLSAMLIFPFGEAVYGKTVFDLAPDPVPAFVHDHLVWDSMRWTKAAGHRYFDLGRMRHRFALEYAATPSNLSSLESKRAFYKLRLGGRVHFAPGAFACIYDPRLRWAYETVMPLAERLGVARRLTDKIRGYGL
jgi:hypothetical protein